ncbi:hypothetical protein KAR91_77570 [Candidatus Pacearchaeota archaeon]|nr:hypothetical protein [Candidatus Pacearchaeota archaeon]
MALLDYDDLKELFDIDEDAVEAYYAPLDKTAKKVVARFPYEEDFSQASIDPFLAEDESPQLKALAITEDVPSVKHKDTLKIDDTTYKIKRSKKLRTGLSVLYLYE